MDYSALRSAVDEFRWKKNRIRMARADCLKIIFEIASVVDPRYKILANDVAGRVYDDWMALVKADYIRERFYALGGKEVDSWKIGDILFFTLRFTPVDHAGLALNEREFVHLTRKGVIVDRVDKFSPVSAGRIC